MLMEESPAVHWFEAFDKELDVVGGIRLSAIDGGLVDRRPESVPGMEFGRREGADVFPRADSHERIPASSSIFRRAGPMFGKCVKACRSGGISGKGLGMFLFVLIFHYLM